MDITGVQIHPVPGLERDVVLDDLRRSRIKHNKLLNDSKIPPLDQQHVAYLSRVIEKFNAKEIFGFHVGHKHFDLAMGTHLVGQLGTYDKRQYYWTRPIENSSSDPHKLCGHTFVYDQDEGFRPYGFHAGPLPDLSMVDRKLFSEFGGYVAKHKLEHYVALEYLIPELRGRDMSELVLHEQKHILLCEQEIVKLSLGEPIVTAYRHVQPGVAFGPGTRYFPLPEGGHKTYNPEEVTELKDLVDTFSMLNVVRI
jgi:hypothetical protein